MSIAIRHGSTNWMARQFFVQLKHLWRNQRTLRAITGTALPLLTVRCAERAPQKRACADSAQGEGRRRAGPERNPPPARGRRREAALQGGGRHRDRAMQAAFADGCRARDERRLRGGGARRRTAAKRARANRAAHRPRSGTQRCEMHRTGKRPLPNAIWRLRSGAGAMRDGAFRARVPLGRWTAHADWHRTPASHTAPHACRNARLMPSVRNPLTYYVL